MCYIMTANGFTLLTSEERDKLYGISSKDNKNKKGEKPAAWSKKDEKMFEYALNMIEWYSGKNKDKSRFVSDWLKSIKQRIGE